MMMMMRGLVPLLGSKAECPSLGMCSFIYALDVGNFWWLFMYSYKLTVYGDGDAHVAHFLFAITNSERAYGSLVVGIDICEVWDLCCLFFWSL
jgi:hypothetical protein